MSRLVKGLLSHRLSAATIKLDVKTNLIPHLKNKFFVDRHNALCQSGAWCRCNFRKKFPPVDGWHECGQRSNKTVYGVFLHTTEAPPATKMSSTTFGALIAGCATALLPPTGQAKTPRQEALVCRSARWWRSLFKEGKRERQTRYIAGKTNSSIAADVTTPPTIGAPMRFITSAPPVAPQDRQKWPSDAGPSQTRGGFRRAGSIKLHIFLHASIAHTRRSSWNAFLSVLFF